MTAEGGMQAREWLLRAELDFPDCHDREVSLSPGRGCSYPRLNRIKCVPRVGDPKWIAFHISLWKNKSFHCGFSVHILHFTLGTLEVVQLLGVTPSIKIRSFI